MAHRLTTPKPYNEFGHVAKELGQPITILLDLQGPKIRTGEIKDGQIHIKSGDKLTLTTETILGNQNYVSVDYAKLPDSAQVGGRILLDDGNLELNVEAINPISIETRVILGGTLKTP